MPTFRVLVVFALAASTFALNGNAQQRDTVIKRPATTAVRAAMPPKPPLSPKRAFITSAIIPGLAQAKMNRPTAGALFAAVELGSIAMWRHSNADVLEARRFTRDSLPADYIVSSTGVLTPSGTFAGRFSSTLVRTRRLHVEDWLAAVVFTHLIAGADAFVSAQLWDVSSSVSLAPSRNGAALVASVKF